MLERGLQLIFIVPSPCWVLNKSFLIDSPLILSSPSGNTQFLRPILVFKKDFQAQLGPFSFVPHLYLYSCSSFSKRYSMKFWYNPVFMLHTRGFLLHDWNSNLVALVFGSDGTHNFQEIWSNHKPILVLYRVLKGTTQSNRRDSEIWSRKRVENAT